MFSLGHLLTMLPPPTISLTLFIMSILLLAIETQTAMPLSSLYTLSFFWLIVIHHSPSIIASIYPFS
jgi:hypothetical protein